jgi:hypothetical protein
MLLVRLITYFCTGTMVPTFLGQLRIYREVTYRPCAIAVVQGLLVALCLLHFLSHHNALLIYL